MMLTGPAGSIARLQIARTDGTALDLRLRRASRARVQRRSRAAASSDPAERDRLAGLRLVAGEVVALARGAARMAAELRRERESAQRLRRVAAASSAQRREEVARGPAGAHPAYFSPLRAVMVPSGAQLL